MARVSLDLLQQFVQVARLGNLSRAAEQANLTVSALSHQVRQLEQRLERRLFDRGPRGVQLTPEGRRLMEAVGHHFEGIDRALSGYRVHREEALTLSAIPGVMSSWLVPRLARLVAAHPELELNLQSSVELVNFDRDPVDAAMRYGRGPWPGLITSACSTNGSHRWQRPPCWNACAVSIPPISPNGRYSAIPAIAGATGSRQPAANRRGATWLSSTTPMPCSVLQARAWAWRWGAW